jgi:hypothetical protein
VRVRLRPAYTEAELARIYAQPHSHAGWPDHVLRVARTIELAEDMGEQFGHPYAVADLSCGDAAIARAVTLAHDMEPPRVILGDYAPGYELTGLIEQTIHRIPVVDLFICSETIEHLDDPDTVLKLIRGKASHLVLSTPLGETRPDNPEHYWGWDQDGVREMLKAANWTPAYERIVHYSGNGQWQAATYQLWGCY